jgi:glycosyltransferase involved in cell wall biosynthesis
MVNVRSERNLFNRMGIFRQEIKTADVVHLHGAFDLKLCAVHSIITLEKIRRLSTGKPLHIVMTPHGALSGHVFSTKVRRKWIYWHFVERLLAKQTSLVICTTPGEAQELGRLIPEMRVAVVPLVVSENEVPVRKPKSRVEPKPVHMPLLCTLGRYDINTKGLDLLISAVVKLNSGGTPVRLRCIGYNRNGGTAELEAFVKSVNAGAYIDCMGPKFGEEKYQAVEECDVFCMPSRYESFSYALMEGMASGLPVLVGSGACLTSYFDKDQKQALVVAPTTDAWASSIQQLLVLRRQRMTIFGRF